MTVQVNAFGAADAPAKIFSLTNANGMKVSVTDFGASVVSILVPSKTGALTDVTLGYNSYEGYLNGESFQGASVGRIANRIGGGSIVIDGVTYTLDKNFGEDTLHGGFDQYGKRFWETADIASAPDAVTFRLLSPNGDQGMPGNADISVAYTLTDDNALEIRYRAVSDADTFFNFTNHTYFNLNGAGHGNVLNHRLLLNCGHFTPTDADCVSTGEIRSVEGTPFDFRTPKSIGRDIGIDDEQFHGESGFDQNYVIDHPSLEIPFARVWSEETGIELTAFTNLPGVQLYTGNFLTAESDLRNGPGFGIYDGFTLETQYFPDTPHHENFPSALYGAGQEMSSTTVYQFSVK
ncbi:MAG: galactose mutarotase [Clostridiales Family XIII bacterium]|jgi:aldose 1-epimerase|nr:galactose mutarotase [Clostridiales Family XIII bacterium]